MSDKDSSSESDNDSRRRVSRPPPHGPFEGSKSKSTKKKKPLPPQEAINKIWSRFSVSKFSKATVILPFAAAKCSTDTSKVIPPPKPQPNNLLVSEDFDRAVQECRMKVRKLIKECKRVNMRYRDPTFDIDWDLKWEKGYCLNGLVESRFDINGRAFANPTSDLPKAVKRVHEIFERPTFLKEEVSPADVKQGSLGDCWLMASLTALANMDVGIQRICVEYDTKIGIYGFVFHRDGEWIISIIDDKLYLKSPDWDSPSVQRHLLEQTDREDVENEYRKTYQTGSQALFFAHCRDQNETWLPLLEKAYAKAHGDYAALQGGWIGEGVEDLTGGVTTELLTSDILDTDEFWINEILKVNKEFLFGCSTGILDGGYGSRDGISERHAYVIMEARELSTRERLLKLRNPWGKGKKGNWEGAWSDGSKEFTPEAQKELNHKFGNDSVFWISYEDLLRKYQHFDRTRLFRDSPDWRITQKWISVEVPWHAEFEEKFRIVLEKESPVVLVLSQLDGRYFDGLHGQYRFRLQFRLHEVNSPGEEDYIVRSHGNYLMERSVVTELKSLAAGTYSVFVQVVADRDTNASSVEDVIKAQCQGRVDNDKLAQVGAMYDIAHSKGAVYTNSKVAVRKAHEKQRARVSRIAARRKNWERRHLSREIVRKQEKKNREKRARKESKDLVEAKNEAAKEPKDKAVQTDDAKEVEIVKEDRGIQTEEPPKLTSDESELPGMPTLAPQSSNAGEKGVQTTWISSTSPHSTPETPKSNTASMESPTPHIVRISAHSGPPPPPPARERKNSISHQQYSRTPALQPQYLHSDGESSASPISDFDDLYSDDDPTLKPRRINTTGESRPEASKRGKDSDDEDDHEPWNAVCIVGFRVYSKDENLQVRIHDVSLGDVESIAEENDGTDADVEDGAEENQGKLGEASRIGELNLEKNETKSQNGEPALPIPATKMEELILDDGEKKASALRSEESAVSADGGASIIDEAVLSEKRAVEKEEMTAST